MKFLKIFFCMSLSKLAIFAGKLVGKKSSSFPGQLARKFYPTILNELWSQVKKETIIVTGTNGKTTTNNLIRDILQNQGFKVVCNHVGANMINGVTTAFIQSANLFGKLDSDYACIEVDEASLQKVVDEIIPNKIVVTNLFRDQLDRYGEIDLTIQAINKGLDKIKNVKLILNADDPLTSQFGIRYSFEKTYYGISDVLDKPIEESREGRFCVICGEELHYTHYFYSQLGDYYCTNCDLKRPKLDIHAANITLKDDITFTLKTSNISEEMNINYSGFYNIYNCLAAISATIDIVDLPSIKSAFSNYKPQIGRMERFNITKPVILNLSKNPAGFNQAIQTVNNDSRYKNILIIINDNAQDGRDISWLWDVDFENLNNSNVYKYHVSGIRKEDMAVRLKYANINIDNIIIQDDIKKSILKMIDDNVEVVYVLVNYTALFETQDVLKTLEKVYKDVK